MFDLSKTSNLKIGVWPEGSKILVELSNKNLPVSEAASKSKVSAAPTILKVSKKVKNKITIRKKIKMNNKSILTLDNQHSDKMKEFHNLENKIIPDLKTRKKELKKKLKITTKIEDKLNIQDEIREIRKKIKELEQKKRHIY